MLLDGLNDLLDVAVRLELQAADGHVDVVLVEVGSHTLHLLRPRGAPHERLAIGADLPNNLAELGLETHVEHPVGFVKHQVGHAAQVRLAALQEVNKATRRRNADLHTALQVTDLATLRGSAEYAGVLDARRRAKALRLLLDLLGQLAGRRKDQHDRAVTGAEVLLRVNVHDRREQERQRLAGSRLGDAHNVAARQRHRPALALDRSRTLEAGLVHLLQHVLREGALLEGQHGLRDTSSRHNNLVIGAPLDNLLVRALGHIRVLVVEVLLEHRELAHVPLRDGAEPRAQAAGAAAEAATTKATVATEAAAAAVAAVATAAAAAIAARGTVATATTATIAARGAVSAAAAAAVATVTAGRRVRCTVVGAIVGHGWRPRNASAVCGLQSPENLRL
mmetsp:Transcript_76982/g.186254  ORF Transcript_76982/g.186254 Transcript_76982/m.186254 type:complete len:393 (+) Transcript_76982:1144-2322(+)